MWIIICVLLWEGIVIYVLISKETMIRYEKKGNFLIRFSTKYVRGLLCRKINMFVAQHITRAITTTHHPCASRFYDKRTLAALIKILTLVWNDIVFLAVLCHTWRCWGFILKSAIFLLLWLVRIKTLFVCTRCNNRIYLNCLIPLMPLRYKTKKKTKK